jgi:SAM-dependent methyltransferase
MQTGTAEEVRGYYREILPYFEQELADRGDDDFWEALASEPPGSRVLEIGAGTGRATAVLARRAARVVAFDLAPELIAVARQRLRGASNVELLVADARTFAFGERFDLIVAVDDPLVHLARGAERDEAFANVARHLAPGGRFVLDAAWFPPDKRRAAAGPDGLVQERRTSRGLTVREVWRCHPKTRRCQARFEYEVGGKPTASASFPGRLWSREELRRRASSAGLKITSLWGDYDRSPWSRHRSPRLIAELAIEFAR